MISLNEHLQRPTTSLQSPVIKRFHKRIILDALRERILAKMRSMSPGLEAVLLTDRSSEAATPASPRPDAVDVCKRRGVDETRVPAHIVIYSGELDDLAEQRDLPLGA